MFPCTTVCEVGVAEMPKSGGPCTTKVTVVECDRLPLVPVIARVYVLVGVVDAVETVSVEFPESATDAGLKLAVAPVGNPLTLRFTVPVKLFKALIEVV